MSPENPGWQLHIFGPVHMPNWQPDLQLYRVEQVGPVKPLGHVQFFKPENVPPSWKIGLHSKV
jgi:hypothetical protein